MDEKEVPLAQIHTAVAQVQPGKPHFNLPFGAPMQFPHCDFYVQSEDEIAEAFAFNFPQQFVCSSRGQVEALRAVHAPSRLQQFRVLRVINQLHYPELFRMKAVPELAPCAYSAVTFRAFAEQLTCPACRASYHPKAIARAFITPPLDYKAEDGLLAQAANRISQKCKPAFLQHLACERLRIWSLFSRKERAEAVRRQILNELIARALLVVQKRETSSGNCNPTERANDLERHPNLSSMVASVSHSENDEPEPFKLSSRALIDIAADLDVLAKSDFQSSFDSSSEKSDADVSNSMQTAIASYERANTGSTFNSGSTHHGKEASNDDTQQAVPEEVVSLNSEERSPSRFATQSESPNMKSSFDVDSEVCSESANDIELRSAQRMACTNKESTVIASVADVFRLASVSVSVANSSMEANSQAVENLSTSVKANTNCKENPLDAVSVPSAQPSSTAGEAGATVHTGPSAELDNENNAQVVEPVETQHSKADASE